MTEWKETDFGKIPTHWGLKKVIEIKSDDKRAIAMGPFGSNIKAENFVKHGVPVIRGTNLNFERFVGGDFVFLTEEKANELISSNCKAGDLVFTHRGTIGQVALIPENKYERYVISQSGMKLTVNADQISNIFLFYFFKSEYGQYQILKYEAQVGVPSISNPLTSLKEMFVPVPSLTEQTAIADLLSSLDDKIDLLQRQNKTLEALAETLFRQWFVEEAEESWEVKTISDIIEVRDGTHDSPKQSAVGKYLITSKHLKPSGIDFATAYKISEEDFIEVNKRSRVEVNDILFSMIGTLGLIHFVDSEPNYAIKNIGLFKCSKKPKFANFLLLLLKGPIGQKFIHENAVGSTQEYITLGSLRNFEFKYPGEKLISEFDVEIQPLFQKLNSNTIQINTLTNLRDTLLPKLMSGEVKVNIN